MSDDVTYSRIPSDALERWSIVRACVAGDQAMRAAKLLPYLNPQDKSPDNKERNASYVERAVYYNATGRTLNGMLGIAFKKDPSIQLPDYLDYLRTNTDGEGNSIYQQSQVVVSDLMTCGRCGLLVDIVEPNGPVIKFYAPESIINWRYENGKLVMLVLAETVEKQTGYEVEYLSQYREYELVDGRCIVRLWQQNNDGAFAPVLVKDANGQEVEELVLRSKSKLSFDYIPFKWVGSRSNDSKIDDVPLYPLAKLNVAHYRNSADYEDSVFFVGQAQPWISGLTEEWRDYLQKQGTAYVGSRSPFLLPENGAFGFAQPEPNSLVKEAMDQKEAQMVALGARLLDQNAIQVTATQNDNDKEVSTSILSMCVANANEAYQAVIRWCAEMLDKTLTEEEAQASYKINQDYSRVKIDSPALASLVAAWQAGVIAKPDLRAYLRSEGIIATERTDDAIDDDLETEGPALGLSDANA